MTEVTLHSENNGSYRKRTITVRPTTPTREAIQLVIMQRKVTIGERELLAVPTLTLLGRIPAYLESWRFVRDLSIALATASLYMAQWSLDVDNPGGKHDN